jgi:hypothetical protein
LGGVLWQRGRFELWDGGEGVNDWWCWLTGQIQPKFGLGMGQNG